MLAKMVKRKKIYIYFITIQKQKEKIVIYAKGPGRAKKKY